VIGLVETGRATAGRVVNRAITTSGAGYGEGPTTRLSTESTKRFGRGFSPRNLAQMKAFYLWKGILQTVSAKFEEPGKIVSDDKSRAFYESEAIRGGWSARQPDRQISILAYQRMRGKPGRLKGESAAPDEIVPIFRSRITKHRSRRWKSSRSTLRMPMTAR
jgi:hypothetical protein